MPIHHLHEPIDVFSEWLDDCEAAANPRSADQEDDGNGAAVPRYDDEEEEEDDDDDDLGQPSALSRKPAASSSTGNQRASYENLGLDESDDDDE